MFAPRSKLLPSTGAPPAIVPAPKVRLLLALLPAASVARLLLLTWAVLLTMLEAAIFTPTPQTADEPLERSIPPLWASITPPWLPWTVNTPVPPGSRLPAAPFSVAEAWATLPAAVERRLL